MAPPGGASGAAGYSRTWFPCLPTLYSSSLQPLTTVTVSLALSINQQTDLQAITWRAFSIFAPEMSFCSTCSYDGHVATLIILQPFDDQVQNSGLIIVCVPELCTNSVTLILFSSDSSWSRLSWTGLSQSRFVLIAQLTVATGSWIMLVLSWLASIGVRVQGSKCKVITI